MELLRIYSFLLISILIWSACTQKNKNNSYPDNENIADTTPTNQAATAAPIIGERINKNATILTSPGGEPVASLLDYIPLRCAPLQKDYYPVSVDFDITKEEYSKPLFHKNRKIKVNGINAGVLLRDIKLPVSTNGEKMWATIYGFTEKKSIRGGSIIETALTNYIKQQAGRSTENMQPFIRNFKLEKETTLKPYVMYFNYESGIDDPSPLYRLALVFQGKQLIGVLHARPLQLYGSTSRKLQHNFTMSFFNGIDNSLKEDFSMKFNKFITSVD